MSLTKCTVNTNIIESLPDAPILTADELKKRFDKSPTDIKNYINDVMLLEIEQLIASEKKNLQAIINNVKNDLLTNISEKILEDNKKKYYIGKIILDTKNVNPATYLGFGTWTYWGKGRVPVGVNTSDTDFNTVEKTGGEKTHKLTIDEMPSHSHGLNTNIDATGFGSNNSLARALGGKTEWKDNQYYMKSTGGDKAHNNLQPYITCYMWKRIS